MCCYSVVLAYGKKIFNVIPEMSKLITKCMFVGGRGPQGPIGAKGQPGAPGANGSPGGKGLSTCKKYTFPVIIQSSWTEIFHSV